MTMTKMLGIFVVLVYLSALGIFIYTVIGSEEVPVFENEVKTVQLQQPSQLAEKTVKTEKRPINSSYVPKNVPGMKINDLTAEVNQPEKKIIVSFTVTDLNKVAKAYFPPVEISKTTLEEDTLSFNITDALYGYMDENNLDNLKEYMSEADLQAVNDEMNDQFIGFQEEAPPVISARDYGIRYTYGILENIETKWHKMRIPSLTIQGIKDISFNEDEYRDDEIIVINQFDITDDLKPGIYTVNITIIDKTTFKQVSDIVTFEIE